LFCRRYGAATSRQADPGAVESGNRSIPTMTKGSKPIVVGASRHFVRTADRHVFGPVGVQTLQHWAQEGRVWGEHDVSTDRQQWRAARDLPELGLVWVAHWGASEKLGPVNLNALPRLIRGGLVPPDAIMIHAETGARMMASEAGGGRPPEPTAPSSVDEPAAPTRAGQQEATLRRPWQHERFLERRGTLTSPRLSNATGVVDQREPTDDGQDSLTRQYRLLWTMVDNLQMQLDFTLTAAQAHRVQLEEELNDAIRNPEYWSTMKKGGRSDDAAGS